MIGLPQLVRDDRPFIEDIRKVDGDDPPTPRLRPGGRRALRSGNLWRSTVGRSMLRPILATRIGTRDYVTGMPLGEQIARQADGGDATSRAIHFQRLETEALQTVFGQELPRRCDDASSAFSQYLITIC